MKMFSKKEVISIVEFAQYEAIENADSEEYAKLDRALQILRKEEFDEFYPGAVVETLRTGVWFLSTKLAEKETKYSVSDHMHPDMHDRSLSFRRDQMKADLYKKFIANPVDWQMWEERLGERAFLIENGMEDIALCATSYHGIDKTELKERLNTECRKFGGAEKLAKLYSNSCE